MLRSRGLPEILKQANTGGVRLTLLFGEDGDLLAVAGDEEVDPKVTAAIVANMWSCYAQSGEIKQAVVECEYGRVIVIPVSKLLLCLLATREVEIGVLRLKATTLCDYLSDALKGWER